MKPKHQRLVFILLSIACMATAALLIMQALKEEVIYFYSPSDLRNTQSIRNNTIRIGGLVAMGSLRQYEDQKVVFIITDGSNEVKVDYQGLLPNLFREGQGVVAEGTLTGHQKFTATRILAKHDENYMPPDVVDTLKKSGHWKHTQTMDTKEPEK